MTTAKEDDTLSELRHEYKSVKKELSQYDSFIDNHPFVCIFVPFTLSIIFVIVAAVNSISWVGWTALALFVLSIAMLCIVLARTGKIAKINAKLDDIEHEVKLFHSKPLSTTAGADRDELGLWQDISNDDKKSSGKWGWVMGVVVLLVVGSVISYNRSNQTADNNSTLNQAATQQQDTETSLNQYQCLNDAHNAYNTAWDNADTDGDGKLSYADGSHNITTSYYDAAISCYRSYRTADSDGYIADYQAKRQQEVDKYNTHIEAVGNAAAGARNNSSSSMNCTSNSIGSSTYTRCY